MKSTVAAVSNLVHYDTLLQNGPDIIKCDSYFITKCDKTLLQNALGFLLQNATVITNCDVYYKMCRYTHLPIFPDLADQSQYMKDFITLSFSIWVTKPELTKLMLPVV